MHISEMEYKIQKKSSVFKIIAFQVVAENSAYCGQEYLSSAVNVLAKSLKI